MSIPTISTIPALVQCLEPNCKRWYVNEKNLQRHFEKYHGKFKCIMCPKRTFSHLRELQCHILTYHGMKPLGSYPCQYCPAKFGFQTHLHTHLRLSHQDILPLPLLFQKEEQKASGVTKEEWWGVPAAQTKRQRQKYIQCTFHFAESSTHVREGNFTWSFDIRTVP